MKSQIIRIAEHGDTVLYVRPDYRKCPPLKKYFITGNGIYQEFPSEAKAKSAFKKLIA